jgi:hypothetical protein
MGDVLKSINNAMRVIIAWIYTPFVTNMWMRSKLHKYEKRQVTTINNFLPRTCEHIHHLSKKRNHNMTRGLYE